MGKRIPYEHMEGIKPSSIAEHIQKALYCLQEGEHKHSRPDTACFYLQGALKLLGTEPAAPWVTDDIADTLELLVSKLRAL